MILGDKFISAMIGNDEMSSVPVVCEFPDVLPEDPPGLPPSHQLVFRIELVPSAVRVARAPYRLAVSKMQEIGCSVTGFAR